MTDIKHMISPSVIMKVLASITWFFAALIIGVIVTTLVEGKPLADLAGLTALLHAFNARVIPLWVATLFGAGFLWAGLLALQLLRQATGLKVVVRRDSCHWFPRQNVDDEWRMIVHALITFTNNTDRTVLLTAVQLLGIDGEIEVGDKTHSQLWLKPGEIIAGELMFFIDDPKKFKRRDENFTASIIAVDNLGESHTSNLVEFAARSAPEDEERPPAKA